MTYSEAQQFVLSLQSKGWRLGLDRIRELIRRAGLEDAVGTDGNGLMTVASRADMARFRSLKSLAPSQNSTKRLPRFLHIAGTNGKGSVTQYVQSILHEAGYKVGGYYSPYVYDPRERIQFGREYISEEDYASVASAIRPIAAEMESPEFGGGVSKFEFETAMAFLYWKLTECEFVALEVGMGGRLDATNIVHPVVSVIVSIGLDHTEHLGHTFAEIAREKGGIIKPSVPVVVGEVPADAMREIETLASAGSAHVWRYGTEILAESNCKNVWKVVTPKMTTKELRPGLRGVMQPHNMALAVAALDASGIVLDEEAIRRGVASARLPGRMEERSEEGVVIVLDGAHNSDAARSLVQTFQEQYPDQKAILLTGMLDGHDPAEFYRMLSPIVLSAHAVPINFYRALSAEKVAGALVSVGIRVAAYGELSSALSSARREAAEKQVPLLITGSFYLLGEVGPLIGSADFAGSAISDKWLQR